MKQKLISMSILAAVVALSGAPAWAQAVPGTQDKSVGGTQDKRTDRDAQTPMPKESPSAGSTQGEMKGKSPSPSAQTQDKSIGGTQSQRTDRESETPLPKGSRSAGETGAQGEMKGDKTSQPATGRMAGERWAMQDIKGAQEALKNKGHDPGPIDGIMGPQTRQAIKAFQSSSGLKETGNLDSETAKKLGVERGGSSMGPSEKGMGSSSERGTSQRESTGSGKSPSTEKEPSSPMGK